MKDIQALYNQCVDELNSIGIDIKDIAEIDIKLSKRNNKRYGCCKPEEPDRKTKYIIKIRGSRYIKYRRYNKYHIEVSPWVMELDIDIIKNTIMHELIHCFPDCNNHGTEFKKYAKYINDKLGYNIETVGNKKADYQKSNKQFMEENVYNYQIKCVKCGQIFYRKRLNKNFIRKYRCGKCKRKICCTKWKIYFIIKGEIYGRKITRIFKNQKL